MSGPQADRRRSFFGQQVVRLLTKTAAANELGAQAFTLLTVVAAQQDAARGRPVTFYNDQLLPLIGARKWETLAKVRKTCVDAGWLTHTPQPSGTRRPGLYAVTIPAAVALLSDSRCDEGDPLAAEYERGYADGKAGRPPQAYGGDAPGEHIRSADKVGGTLADTVGGTLGGTLGGNHHPLPLPLPNSSCRRLPAGDDATGSKPTKKRRQLKFAAEDRALAEWFWGLIVAMQPGRKPPNLDGWADELRLIRENDGRGHQQVRDLFERVNRDPFWRLNVLSPSKLREKWDDLALKFGVGSAPSSAYRSFDSDGRIAG